MKINSLRVKKVNDALNYIIPRSKHYLIHKNAKEDAVSFTVMFLSDCRVFG